MLGRRDGSWLNGVSVQVGVLDAVGKQRDNQSRDAVGCLCIAKGTALYSTV